MPTLLQVVPSKDIRLRSTIIHCVVLDVSTTSGDTPVAAYCFSACLAFSSIRSNSKRLMRTYTVVQLKLPNVSPTVLVRVPSLVAQDAAANCLVSISMDWALMLGKGSENTAAFDRPAI